ncbi:MAG: FliM/FliN family flagellar motor switch protein [Clostridia bacterium]|nr:FliM/FliN family flagellar motor switch protein [Clostridia bacterium]MDH7573464.1 FliM/FliN family flagellar motor switch protein [Clostridia bacterium]
MAAEGKKRPVGKLPVREAEFGQLTPAGGLRPNKAPLETLGPVAVDITVELGRAWVPVREVLEWEPGSVLRLDKVAGEPAEVLINGCLLGRGEVVVVNERLAFRLRTFREKED